MNNKIIYLISIILLASSCSFKLKDIKYSSPVDTHSKQIEFQTKKVYEISSLNINADNKFDGARMNDFTLYEDSICQVLITPENEPINSSPYYAFRIWSDTIKKAIVQLYYPTTQHRYQPKYSTDGENWTLLDTTKISYNEDSSKVNLQLSLSPDHLWIAAQEIQNSKYNQTWINKLSKTFAFVNQTTIAKSKLGRDIKMLDIHIGNPKNRETILLLSRQHPPEVTGYIAMQSYVEELLKEHRINQDFLKKYRVLVFPMINPDGVDLGHWRHNAAGIDLNRDWAEYHQEEVRAVVDKIVEIIHKDKIKVILGIDFHSTQKDLYYTLSDDLKSSIYPFKDYWLGAIDQQFDNYTPNDLPFKLTQPVSKSWIHNQFGAEAVTYEVGDETPRIFTTKKASIAAQEMIKLLILRN